MGDRPEYIVLNPARCICRTGIAAHEYDVLFQFTVFAGGGRCEHNNRCQGATMSSPDEPVLGTILGPPHGGVIFSTHH